jgi:hypothetical protein
MGKSVDEGPWRTSLLELCYKSLSRPRGRMGRGLQLDRIDCRSVRVFSRAPFQAGIMGSPDRGLAVFKRIA